MKKAPPYIPDRFSPQRRKTIPVKAGHAVIGGRASILVQSMTNTATGDIRATVSQTLKLAEAGCELVRITVPAVKDALSLGEIVRALRRQKCTVPISADIHFQPRAAFEALKWADKVRINPGNFADKKIPDLSAYSPEDFRRGAENIHHVFAPFVREAKARGVSIRIGTNHGSLSDRIMYKYGNTVEGMVESALEYVRVCEDENFDQVVFSMKASNPRVTIEAYRLLAARLEAEHKNYPFHLGVTEAGAGADGRLKSAAGIGALLLDGLGDTIRVSLTEDPVKEIPVARDLIKKCRLFKSGLPENRPEEKIDFYDYARRASSTVSLGQVKAGGTRPIAVGVLSKDISPKSARPHEWISSVPPGKQDPGITILSLAAAGSVELQVKDLSLLQTLSAKAIPAGKKLWSIAPQGNIVASYRYLAAWLKSRKIKDPILLRCDLKNDPEGIKAAAMLGSLLADGIGDAVCLSGKTGSSSTADLTYDILQAAGARRSKTEFISCPGCGRTLYDLEQTLCRVKQATAHLDDVSIAVMGCIVNGPGEMADADFGYVGGVAGKVHLYVGKTVAEKNVDQNQAVDALVALIKKHGRWKEP